MFSSDATQASATMMKNSIFLPLCIYNLDELTYNQMEPLIKLLMRSPITLALFLNFARPPLIKPENARDWFKVGSDVIRSTQSHLSKKCCRHFVHDCERHVCGQIDWVDWMTSQRQDADKFSCTCNYL